MSISPRLQRPGKWLGPVAAMDHEAKGRQVLLEAVRWLEGAESGFWFVRFGAGRLEESLCARGLSNVHFAGWVEGTLSWMMAFDIFVLPSLREGSGSVALDALRAGAPVVASRTDGSCLAGERNTDYVLTSGTAHSAIKLIPAKFLRVLISANGRAFCW